MAENTGCIFCNQQDKIFVDSKIIFADLIPGFRSLDETPLDRYKNFQKIDIKICEDCLDQELRNDQRIKIRFSLLIAGLTVALFFLGFFVPFAWTGMLLTIMMGGLYIVTRLIKKVDPKNMDDLVRLFKKRLSLYLKKNESLVKFWSLNRFEKINRNFPVEVKEN